MIIIKMLILFLIFISAFIVGILISCKYKNRVKDLKEIKKALNIFETKIKFTCEPIPEIFEELSNNLTQNIGEIFKVASLKMKEITAKEAWEESINESNTSMKPEDIEIIGGLGKLLGKTDLDGQVSQIELTNTFLDTQIKKSEKECEKNEKLYKTLRNGWRFSISNNINIKFVLI